MKGLVLRRHDTNNAIGCKGLLCYRHRVDRIGVDHHIPSLLGKEVAGQGPNELQTGLAGLHDRHKRSFTILMRLILSHDDYAAKRAGQESGHPQ